ncbi:MAG: hypothetical protein JXA43_02505 [Candidatus Diapherotrites archaeon]|nr:hypothetical protein [Candidatus Diapherotrites archaeon]
MKKAASPVVSSTLILLVSVMLIALVYIWSQTTVTAFMTSLNAEAQRQTLILSSEITIYPCPETNLQTGVGPTYYIFIDNTGSTTLTNVTTYFDGVQVVWNCATTPHTNCVYGMFRDDPTTALFPEEQSTVLEELAPGDVAWIALGELTSSDLSGVTIYVTSEETSASYTFP